MNLFSIFERRKTILYIWSACFTIYFGHLYFDNGPITKYAQVIVDVINVYCMVWWFNHSTKQSSQSNITKLLFYMYAMFVFYFLVSPSTGVIKDTLGVESSFGQLKIITFAITSFFTAMYFDQKGYFNEATLFIFFIALVVMASLTFLFYREYLFAITGNEFAVNNMGYLICTLFPFSTLMKPKLRYIYWGILLFIVFTGAKRGAIITAASMFFVYLLVYSREMKFYKKIMYAVFIGASIIFMFSYFSDFFETTINRLTDQGLAHNSRNYITNQINTNFWNGSIFHYFVGYGTLGSISLSGNFAHNDWLEMLSDYGLIGLSLYMVFYITLGRTIYKLRKQENQYHTTLCTILVYCLCRSYFSMCFFTIETAVVMFVLGITISRLQNEKSTLIH